MGNWQGKQEKVAMMWGYLPVQFQKGLLVWKERKQLGGACGLK